MSTATFDGLAHTVTIKDKDGKVIATGAANNRTDSHSTLQFVPNGRYYVQDAKAPHTHGGTKDTVDGEYGSYGIIRFDVPGHVGVGLHAGREKTADRTPQRAVGPDHVTQGCIRTNEATMQSLKTLMATDPLESITVVANKRQR